MSSFFIHPLCFILFSAWPSVLINDCCVTYLAGHLQHGGHLGDGHAEGEVLAESLVHSLSKKGFDRISFYSEIRYLAMWWRKQAGTAAAKQV